MAISRLIAWTLILASSTVSAREAATPAACQAAATKAPIADAKNAVKKNAKDLRAQFRLADAWSEAGCFNDALKALVAAEQVNPGDSEVETRLRVARSVVGEEHFFDNLDRAQDEARLKRAAFRCTSLFDDEACAEAVRARPDDPTLWAAQGDAFMRTGHTQEALTAYSHALALKPDQADLTDKMTVAQAQTPAPLEPMHDSAPTQVASVSAAHRIQGVHLPAPHREAAFGQSHAPSPIIAGDSNVESASRSH